MYEKVNVESQVIEITFENLSQEMTKVQLSILVTKILNENKELKGKLLNIAIK
jgi:hypothetical protein